jgi:L-alanine-DL-glutamate epimerase-like enolase superfamily enzyme
MAHDRAVREGSLGRPLTLERVDAQAFEVATENGPESDGTLVWASTTMVTAECRAAGVTGLGYTYATAAAAAVIRDVLAPALVGGDAMAIPAAATRMRAAVRNQGLPGVAACAISAVDVALWDLKAKLCGVAVADLVGAARREVPLYASGGFTSTGLDALAAEIADYAARGFERVKIKIGRDPSVDLDRVRVAREAAGPDVALMMDANGAYRRKQALAFAERAAKYDVVWFEEPVPMEDVEGLRLLRDRLPAGMDLASGEYGYRPEDFRGLIDGGAVDVLQADATRCLGLSGFLHADALCLTAGLPLSSHCAPALHAHASAAARQCVHLEYFRDHARVEAMLFDGVPQPRRGVLSFDPQRPGLGLTLRRDAGALRAV